jgi:ubiquinone/menaquinone biosynthesis C-methylase UbiE
MADPKAVFADVDSSGVAPGLMDYLDRVAARDEMRMLRQDSYRWLGLAPGQTVVDIGCGLGHALAEMAEIVGEHGRVIGVELSSAMAAEAARRVMLPQVDVRIGNLLELDLEDASVDAARAERVFQHVTETARGCAELARVVRPGGSVAILDPDWTSLRIVGPEPALVDEVTQAWEARHPNPSGVLHLREHLLDVGFTSVELIPGTHVHDDLAAAAGKFPSLDRTIPESHWPVAPDVAARWFAQLDDAQARGRFWCTLQGWSVIARKS